MSQEKKCGQCAHFIGAGDWGLACTKMYGLVYEQSDICELFEQSEEAENVSARVGWFFCSLCGANGWASKMKPDGVCPECGTKLAPRWGK